MSTSTSTYTKQELLKLANSLDLKGVQNLNRNDLVNSLLNHPCINLNLEKCQKLNARQINNIAQKCNVEYSKTGNTCQNIVQKYSKIDKTEYKKFLNWVHAQSTRPPSTQPVPKLSPKKLQSNATRQQISTRSRSRSRSPSPKRSHLSTTTTTTTHKKMPDAGLLLSIPVEMFCEVWKHLGVLNLSYVGEILNESKTKPNKQYRDRVIYCTVNVNVDKLEMIGVLSQLTKVQKLVMKKFEHRLKTLPSFFTSLTQLRDVNLRSNNLTELPQAIGNLSQLTQLNLKTNNLTTLPESFTTLSKLINLNLYGNSLTELPQSFGNLSQLKHLNLRQTELRTLPESFARLSELTMLNLIGNLFHKLPDWFGKLTKLQTLKLEENYLKTLPPSFGDLSRLVLLDLSCNDELTTYFPNLLVS